MNTSRYFAFVLGTLIVTATQANAQYLRTIYYVAPDPYGGYLKGAAAVIDAQGRYLLNVQQAYLIREQVRQAELQTRRDAFDHWLYPRAQTPSLEEERERARKEAVQRAQNGPALTEVLAGWSLNVLLQDIQQLHAQGVRGVDVELDQAVLKQINVSTGKAGGNIGVLRNGRLCWPLVLRSYPVFDQDRALLDALVEQALAQAASGSVDAKVLTEMSRTAGRLREQLVRLAKTGRDAGAGSHSGCGP